MSRLLLFLSLLLPAYGMFGSEQNVNVTGTLLCHGKPAVGVTVLLGEYDWPDKNDIMASTKTDAKGAYTLAGSEVETFAIQPFLAIGHFCQPTTKRAKKCLRSIYLNLPETVIGFGEPATQVQMADINLESSRDNEHIYCGKHATIENIIP